MAKVLYTGFEGPWMHSSQFKVAAETYALHLNQNEDHLYRLGVYQLSAGQSFYFSGIIRLNTHDVTYGKVHIIGNRAATGVEAGWAITYKHAPDYVIELAMTDDAGNTESYEYYVGSITNDYPYPIAINFTQGVGASISWYEGDFTPMTPVDTDTIGTITYTSDFTLGSVGVGGGTYGVNMKNAYRGDYINIALYNSALTDDDIDYIFENYSVKNWEDLDPSRPVYSKIDSWYDFNERVDLGDDKSPNNNNWMLFSVTAANWRFYGLQFTVVNAITEPYIKKLCANGSLKDLNVYGSGSGYGDVRWDAYVNTRNIRSWGTTLYCANDVMSFDINKFSAGFGACWFGNASWSNAQHEIVKFGFNGDTITYRVGNYGYDWSIYSAASGVLAESQTDIPTTVHRFYEVGCFMESGSAKLTFGVDGERLETYINTATLSCYGQDLYIGCRNGGSIRFDDFCLNDTLSAFAGDPNTKIPEPHSFTCNTIAAVNSPYTNNRWLKSGTELNSVDTATDALLDYNPNTTAISNLVGDKIGFQLAPLSAVYTSLDILDLGSSICAINMWLHNVRYRQSSRLNTKIKTTANEHISAVAAPVTPGFYGVPVFYQDTPTGSEYQTSDLNNNDINTLLEVANP